MPSVIDKIVDKYRPEIVVNHHDALTDSIREAVSLAFAEAFGMAWDWMYNKSPASREAYIDFMMKQARSRVIL